MQKILILLFSLFFGAHAYAITLNEALEAAYENNVVLKAKREELKKRDEAIMEAMSRMLPNVRVSKTKVNGKNVPSQQRQDPPSNETTQTMDGITSQLTLQQNLFRGGSDFASLMSARNSVEASRAELDYNEQIILKDVVESFLKLKGSDSKYQNAKKMVVETKQYVNATEKRFEAGEVTKTDVARAKSAYADAKARQSKYWSEFISEKVAFKNFTGLEGHDLILPDVGKLVKIPANMDEAIAVALRNSPRMISADRVKKAATENVKSHLGTLMPSVDLIHQVEDNNHAPVLSSNRNYRFKQTTAIQVTVPIFDGGASWSKVRAAKRASKQSQYDLANTNNEVTRMAIASWSGFDASKSILSSRKDALEAAKIAFEGAKEEEKAGIRASVDVMQAHHEYFANYEYFVDARTSFYVSLYTLKVAIGECTAKGLNLKVKLYDPLKNYNNIKWQLIGAY